jgi:hypothetical protein
MTWDINNPDPRHSVPNKDPFRWWPVTPATISGTDDETVYGAYLPIDPPTANSGLFSVPGCTIESDHGGYIVAAVEFWSDTEKLSEADVATLTAVKPPETRYDYGISDCSASSTLGQTGEVVGDWVTYWQTIPAGHGIMFGGAFGINGGGGTGNASWSASMTLDFGDTNGNVVLSVPVCSASGSIRIENGSTTTLSGSPAVTQSYALSWGGAVKKFRIKLNITENTNAYVAASVGSMYLARFY